VEFFIGFKENIEVDILRVVEESRTSRKVLANLDATSFIAIIPKITQILLRNSYQYLFVNISRRSSPRLFLRE
jgi:hypothetical protein